MTHTLYYLTKLMILWVRLRQTVLEMEKLKAKLYIYIEIINNIQRAEHCPIRSGSSLLELFLENPEKSMMNN